MNKFSYLLIILLCISCKPKNPEVNITDEFSQGVWILNEGNFNFANATVDFYKKPSSQLLKDVFSEKNGRPIGDVLQSITYFEDKYFLVVNNSGKIEVVSKEFKTIGVIEGFTSPRYFHAVSLTKSYVTDFLSKGIWIVNPLTNKIISKIDYGTGYSDPTMGWTEQILQIEDLVYVTAVKTGNILIIDPKSDSIIDSIQVEKEPQWIVKDKNSMLWVLSNKSVDQKPGWLQKIDPINKKIVTSFQIQPIGGGPFRLKINSSLDTLYFINGGIFKIDIATGKIPSLPFIEANDKNFYGLGIDPFDNNLYASSIKHPLQPSLVFRYSSSVIVDSFYSGIFPIDFLFVK